MQYNAITMLDARYSISRVANRGFPYPDGGVSDSSGDGIKRATKVDPHWRDLPASVD
jgi:hypothetical protein